MIVSTVSISLFTSVLIGVLLCNIKVTEAHNNSTDCIRDLKAEQRERNDERFSDVEIELLCRQKEEWESAKENPPVSQKPKTPNQSAFLNKLTCKTIKECLGTSSNWSATFISSIYWHFMTILPHMFCTYTVQYVTIIVMVLYIDFVKHDYLFVIAINNYIFLYAVWLFF